MHALAAAALIATLLISGAGAAGSDTAGEPAPGGADLDAWQFVFIPYLWLTEVHGSIGIGDLTVPIDVGFDKVFDLLGAGDLIGGMGYFEVSRRKLTFFVDATGSVVRTDQKLAVGKADLKVDFATVEFGAGYRVLETAGGDISIDGLVGGRYNFLFNAIDIEGGTSERAPQRSVSIDFVDPFVGGRWSVRLIDDLSLFFRGDIGGFGAGSQLAWSLLSGFRYQTPWTLGGGRLSALAAYKVYDFDYESGSGTGRRAIAQEFRGPAIGLGATF